MRRLPTKIAALTLLLAGVLGVLSSVPVYAEDDGCVETNLFGKVCDIKDGEGVFIVLRVILTIMTFGVGIVGTIGIVISGIQYITAKDNEQQVAKAKTRIIQIVIGMAIWFLLEAVLNWLFPGSISTNP